MADQEFRADLLHHVNDFIKSSRRQPKPSLAHHRKFLDAVVAMRDAGELEMAMSFIALGALRGRERQRDALAALEQACFVMSNL